MLRLADPGQRLGDRRVGGQDHRLAGHHAAGGVLGVLQQLAHRLGLVGLHELEQPVAVDVGELGQHVRGVVRVHRLEHVGGPALLERAEDEHLVGLGQLAEHVGQPLVVQRLGHLVPALGRQFLQGMGEVSGVELAVGGQQRLGALSRLRQRQARRPRPRRAGAAARGGRAGPAPGRRAWRAPSRRCGSAPCRRRRRAPGRPDSLIRTARSSSSPSTRVSPARCSKRLRLRVPEASITAPASIAVTRPIGTKIRRRATTSTTRPSTRGAALSTRSATTTSRDLADPVTVGVEDGQPGQSGHISPGHRRHDW